MFIFFLRLRNVLHRKKNLHKNLFLSEKSAIENFPLTLLLFKQILDLPFLDSSLNMEFLKKMESRMRYENVKR